MGDQFSPTDLSRWRLATDAGRHRWIYVAEPPAGASEQSEAERYLLGLPFRVCWKVFFMSHFDLLGVSFLRI